MPGRDRGGRRAGGGERARGMSVTIAVVAALAALVLAVGVGTFLLVHVTGSPQDTATTFLTDWQTRFYGEMDGVTVNAPEGGVAGPLKAAAAQLNLRSLHLTLGQVTQNGSSAQAKFTATATIAGGRVEVPGPAAAGDLEPRVVRELEPIGDLPIAPGRRAVRAARGVASTRAGARGRRHRAELAQGGRAVRVHRAGERQRGAGHRRPGQEAGPAVPGR